jgi:hypothetical protein
MRPTHDESFNPLAIGLRVLDRLVFVLLHA